jgi:DNA-directed RNA polymerase specialized sigma24 family protein
MDEKKIDYNAMARRWLRNLRYYRVALVNAEENVKANPTSAGDLIKLKRKVTQIERCLEALPSDEKEILTRAFVKNQRHEDIEDERHISYSTYRRKMKRGIRNMAIMLFGDKAEKSVC